MRTTSLISAGLALWIFAAAGVFAADKKDDAAQVFTKAVSATSLDEERGGKNAEGQTQTQINNQTQIFNTSNVKGSVDNVTVINSLTGTNSIDGGSFSGASGFPMVIQNSGNGVLIQNSTILNVTIEQ